MPNHILVIFNPVAHSGKSQQDYDLFLQFLEANKISYTTYTTQKDDNAAHIEKIVKNGNYDCISVVGGDGTLNQTVNSLSAQQIPIHPIPAGTGNDLVKMVYPNLSQPDIFAKVLSSTYQRVDLWQCNDAYFINGFGSGFDGAVSHATHGEQYPLLPKLKYWIEILKLIINFRSQPLFINGEKRSNFMLAAANGQVYGGGFKVAPLAFVNDGLLDIIEIAPVPVWKRFLYLPKIERGKHLNLDIISHSRADSITIQSTNALKAHLDGEPLLAKQYFIKHAGQFSIPS